MQNDLRAIDLHRFADRERVAAGLAGDVAEQISAGIAERGEATIAVSGGSTPKRFFEVLSGAALPWRKVTITLVDERFVPPDSDRSNQRLVAEHLLKGGAADARFVPLYQHVADVDAAAALAAGKIDTLHLPFDVVVLGMGGDGHTASFFPGGNNLAEALEGQGARSVVSMEASDASEPRLTLTLPALLPSRLIALHIEGQTKMERLEAARGPGSELDMPIRAVLDRVPAPLAVYWAP